MKNFKNIKFLYASKLLFLGAILFLNFSCKSTFVSQKNNPKLKEVTAKDILGNPNYQAICYGGYRGKSRDIQPTISQLKEDLKILSAMQIKIVRTYNVHLKHASNVLLAISELKKENPDFEMYVMLGAWIDCKNAWTEFPTIHHEESDRNKVEIEEAVRLANLYPDIIKVIAVGNEAMIKWATSYYVEPHIILKWVQYLQELKRANKLDRELWITSSDDFASWGGGDASYRTRDLEAIIRAVDYVSFHTYPFHNSHYNPQFWKTPEAENALSDIEKTNKAMERALQFAINQYNNVKEYVHSISPNKPIHIGETGWASISDGLYGADGSRAADEYKQALFYKSLRKWSTDNNISCFYFEAFDEPWKDSRNINGSENYFGLFTVDGKAKYILWESVDKGIFSNLKRDGNPIIKTHSGDKKLVLETVIAPPN
jgi:exo-beta-1,3-glucanase (GH17 family)